MVSELAINATIVDGKGSKKFLGLMVGILASDTHFTIIKCSLASGIRRLFKDDLLNVLHCSEVDSDMAVSFRRLGGDAKIQDLSDMVFSGCFVKNQILSHKKTPTPLYWGVGLKVDLVFRGRITYDDGG
jgi:hypothetical protein